MCGQSGVECPDLFYSNPFQFPNHSAQQANGRNFSAFKKSRLDEVPSSILVTDLVGKEKWLNWPNMIWEENTSKEKHSSVKNNKIYSHFPKQFFEERIFHGKN